MNYKRFLFGILIISISSLLYFDILISDFRITFAIVSMGVFLYLFRKADPIFVGIIIGMTTFAIRMLLYFIEFGKLTGVGYGFIPEIFFYIAYGVFFKYIVYKKKINQLDLIFVVALFSDFFSNVFEITLRIAFFHQEFSKSIFPVLFLVALIRTVILILILKGIKIYKLLLLKEEHELRYQRLIHMTLLLKDEMYWFEKNKIKIEKSMSEAYKLFELLKDSNNRMLADQSLRVASDIHEIKKEYELVLRGFKDITEEKYEIQKMKFSDMIKILQTTMDYSINQKNLDVSINYFSSEDFSTKKHFELMSILRNLISNSLDALPENRKGKIFVKHYKRNEYHHFIVEDTGKGIPGKFINEIFNAGYSTKIDYSTGEINRGLGLSLAKDIIENKFEGNIRVESHVDNGTKFSIVVNKLNLED
ncbi:MAG: sensor histidine kinase [Clostridiales bacterium]|nr:sensor histidine kinase [Clostridiales bacterium]